MLQLGCMALAVKATGKTEAADDENPGRRVCAAVAIFRCPQRLVTK
jgi:hypothetical protein